MARTRRVKPDEQLTLVEHLDELRSRIVVSLAVLTVAIAVCFYKSAAILAAAKRPAEHAGPPTSLRVPGHQPARLLPHLDLDRDLHGLLLTMPIATYQLYAFVIPAFAEHHHASGRW